MMRKISTAIVLSTLITGCSKDADVVSHNISTAADMFQINRRIVFYNGITGEYILTVTGLCSIGNADNHREVSITCKTSATDYKKHFLGLSDNVTYFAEQIDASTTSPYMYAVVFKPLAIVPNIQVRP